jgi:hypothetical protein
MEGYSTKLEINNFLYEKGLDFVNGCRHRDAETQLKAIERVSAWASSHNPGRFADGALENVALELGSKLNTGATNYGINIPARKQHLTRTLHLVTTMYDVGGHTRFLIKWVESDKSAEHIIVLTSQMVPVGDFLQEIINKSGNYLVCLPPYESIENRAWAVRNISASCDRVILHTHQNDSIPIVAFAKAGGPPVAMFNHAHFSFNLSCTVSDMIINTIEYYRNISEKHRFAKSTAILAGSTGLWPISDNIIDKEAAKRELTLPERATVILSMAHEKYYEPMNGYNFFKTAISILKELPDAYMMIVGVKKDNPFVPDVLRSNPRFLLLGYVNNPIVHYMAADIFLESFPMPSLGAVTEAIAYGEAFPVPVYGPTENILRVQRQTYSFAYRPSDEAAYVTYVKSLTRRKADIRAEAQKMRLHLADQQQHYECRLSALNSKINGLRHSPCEIPVTNMIESDDCRILAELDQSDIGEKINTLFSFVPSIYHHGDAVLKGHQSSGLAIRRIGQRVKSALEKRLHRHSQ